jgi:hypothetical protein
MHIAFSSLGSEQCNLLLLFAVFFLLVVGLVLVIISVAFINEQSENEIIAFDFLNEVVENSRIARPASSLSDLTQPLHDTFLWKIGLFNIVLNMSLFAALYTYDKRLKSWVFESMCWRLLFCLGGTWTSLYDFKLVSNKMHRYNSVITPLIHCNEICYTNTNVSIDSCAGMVFLGLCFVADACKVIVVFHTDCLFCTLP